MNKTNKNAHEELEFNLGHVALGRSNMYQLLATFMRYPTKEFSQLLLSDDFPLMVAESVQWVNEKSGIFDEHVTALKGLSENNCENGSNELLNEMKEEYKRLFILEDEENGLSFQTGYDDSTGTSSKEVAMVYAEEGFQVTIDAEELQGHIALELDYLSYLCKKEGVAWHESDVDGAKELRRKQRDFIVTWLRKWSETYFSQVKKATGLEAYAVIASLAHTYMRLEDGY